MIYIIALKDSTRKNECMKHLRQQGFDDIHIFDAVDTRNKTTDELSMYLNVRSLYELTHGRQTHDGISGKGCIGCFLSHAQLWEKCLYLNKPLFIVEDDCKFTCTYEQIKSTIAKNNYKFLSFENLNPTTYRISAINDETKFNGTQGYYITPYTAKILLQEYQPICTHVDYYIYYMSKKYPDIFYTTSVCNDITNHITSISHIGHDNSCIKMYLPCNKNYYLIFIVIIILLFILK